VTEPIRIGRISSINYEAGKVRVLYQDRDKEVTPEIPLLCDEYYMPKRDDLVMVLHLPNGSTAGCVLGRLWSEQNKPPESGEGLYRKDFDRDVGKAMLRYDAKTGEMKLYSEGELQLEGIQKVLVNGKEIKISGEKVEITGAVGDVIIGGVSLVHHTHEADGGVTGEPIA